MVIYDRFGRPINGARISLNSADTCNFNCVFCHREGIYTNDILMRPEDIGRVTKILCRYGVKYVKITGGEPMLRPDILEIIQTIKQAGIDYISMTTNGTRLAKLAYDLKHAGLDRVNISLHSLRRDRFKLITNIDRHEETLKAIENSIDANLTPVKLNVVLLRNINDDEIHNLIQYSKELGGSKTNILQFIELLNVNDDFYNKFHVDPSIIIRSIKEMIINVRYRKLQNRPVYTLKNGVQIEIVKPMYNHAFCMGSDRIRITHDGKFKPCLMRNDNLVDFLSAIRKGADDEELAKLFLEAVMRREPYFKEEIIRHKGHIDTSTCLI